MKRTTFSLLIMAGALLAGCVPDPRLFQPYYQPAPPPLQPYVEPLKPPPVVHRRAVRRHYHRKHRQPLCPCTQPVQ